MIDYARIIQDGQFWVNPHDARLLAEAPKMVKQEGRSHPPMEFLTLELHNDSLLGESIPWNKLMVTSASSCRQRFLF